MRMGEVEGTSARRASERVERIDRPPEFFVTIHREIRVGYADSRAFDDLRCQSAEAGAIVDAGLQHDESLLSRIDSAMGEYTEVHRLVTALGDYDLDARRRSRARIFNAEYGGAAQKGPDAGIHRSGDGELAVGYRQHAARNGERLPFDPDRRAIRLGRQVAAD